jgi:hypothetical protein
MKPFEPKPIKGDVEFEEDVQEILAKCALRSEDGLHEYRDEESLIRAILSVVYARILPKTGGMQ